MSVAVGFTMVAMVLALILLSYVVVLVLSTLIKNITEVKGKKWKS